MAQKRNRPLEITPLSSPLAPINSPLTQISTGAKIEHPGSLDSPPAFTERIAAIDARQRDQASRGRPAHRIAAAAPGVAPAVPTALKCDGSRRSSQSLPVVSHDPILTTATGRRGKVRSSGPPCLDPMQPSENSAVRSVANGLARSNHPGGISTEGVHRHLLRTLSSDITCQSS